MSVAGATVDGFAVLRVNRSPRRATVTPVSTTRLRAVLGDAPFPLFAGRLAPLAGALGLVGLAGAAVYARRVKN